MADSAQCVDIGSQSPIRHYRKICLITYNYKHLYAMQRTESECNKDHQHRCLASKSTNNGIQVAVAPVFDKMNRAEIADIQGVVLHEW